MTKSQHGIVAVKDRGCRARITCALRHLGWNVTEHASGFHVVQAISEVISGDAIARAPDLIVVDAISAGCSGVTIAVGLHELGLAIPVILVVPTEAPERM